MARSIHTTRRELEEEHRWQYSDDERKDFELKRTEEYLDKKKKLKKNSRKADNKADILPTLPEQVAIRTVDEGQFVHFAASHEDIRQLLRLLPSGIIDGLDAIELCLNVSNLEKAHFDEPDPLVGRAGDKLIPGVYHAAYLGEYREECATIWLFAFVYDATALADREMWEFYLRFHALSVLMHEIAHHYDETNRTIRRRWHTDDEEHQEHYACEQEYIWTRDIVIPYLEPVPKSGVFHREQILSSGAKRFLT